MANTTRPLRSVNLNLIPVLRVLLRTRNVSRAADELAMTQSGCSAALRRLREAFEDPLLVQVGQRMELTERAAHLVEPVEELLHALEKVFHRPVFDPATLNRRFVIWTVDFVAFQVAMRLIPVLQVEAPGVSLQFVQRKSAEIETELDRGEIDLAIVPVNVLPLKRATTESAPLFRDEYVAVVRIDHALASLEELPAEQVADHSYVAFNSGENWDEDHQRLVSGHDLDFPVLAELQQISLLPMLASATDTVAIALRSAAERIADLLPLRILRLPGKPVAHDIHVLWSSIHGHDLALAWFRKLLIEQMRQGRPQASGAASATMLD